MKLLRWASLAAVASSVSAFNWNSITPGTSLDYRPCYRDYGRGFECARLALPLDYTNGSNPHNISLAVVRLPASVPEDHPDHGGSIVINPGGPGDSGVYYALNIAKTLQGGLGAKGGKQFEIVGFDPRGLLNSKPNMYCFATPADTILWQHEKRAKGALDASEYALEWQWQFDLARGRVCEESKVGQWIDGDDIRRYVSTTSVARDMLELVKAIHSRKATLAPATPANHSLPKLQYYGLSYGTFLGQLFASVYPEHVGRMILDSNIDADNWVSVHQYTAWDAEAIRAYFFDTCFAAGKQCKFWHRGDTSASDLQARYTAVVERLSQQPSLMTGEGRAYLLTPERLEVAFFATLYYPSFQFALLGQLLQNLYMHLEHGAPLPYTFVWWEQSLPTHNEYKSPLYRNAAQTEEITAFIHCADGPDLTDHNITRFQQHLAELEAIYPPVAAEQANYKLPCYTMAPSLRTRWRYAGPFGSNSTTPLLFFNNHLDPATAAKNARRMAGRFQGSQLVVSGNVGHGALEAGGPCMWKYARRYMQDGSLPDAEGFCKETYRPSFDEST